MKWKSKFIPPFGTKQKSSCWTRESRSPYYQSSFLLSPQAETFVQGYLKDWSACDITITLVFNPASLDPGKTLHVLTSEVLRHVTKWLDNCFKIWLLNIPITHSHIQISWVMKYKHMRVSMYIQSVQAWYYLQTVLLWINREQTVCLEYRSGKQIFEGANYSRARTIGTTVDPH